MSSGPNLSLSTPTPSSDFLGPLSWQLPSLRNMRPTSRSETGAQHISWSQGRSISRSLPRHPWLVTRAFFLSSLSTYFSDVVHYSGTECSFSLLSFTSVPPDSILDNISMNINYLSIVLNSFWVVWRGLLWCLKAKYQSWWFPRYWWFNK